MKIQIREPWWSAWQKFGWEKGIWGVGINSKDIEAAIDLGEDIELFIGKTGYTVVPTEIKNYARTNNTIHRARYNTILYVVPEKVLRGKGE